MSNANNDYAKLIGMQMTPVQMVDTITALRAEVERLSEVNRQITVENRVGDLLHKATIAERDQLRSQLSARDAEVRALRELVAKFRAWVQHHDDCDEYPLDGYEREHGVPAGESVCNCGLNALLTGEPGPGGSDGT